MVENLVAKTAEELRLREAALDEAMSRARRARIFSKQAIHQIHGGVLDDAAAKLETATSLLDELEAILADRPEIMGYDTINAAREEYSEAMIIQSLKTGGGFPDPDQLRVPITSYIMGLADVPGELRRQTLDALRVGDMESAEALLGSMERIYLSLIAMEEAPLLKGLRRKLDIARGVIERTRSEVTAEAGRRRLDESVRRLAEKME